MTPNPPEQIAATEEGQGAPEAALPLLPTRELVLFPKMVAPIFVGRGKSISAIEAAFGGQTPLILCAQREAAVEDPSFDDLRPVGVRARVLQLFKLPDGSVKALVEGDERVRAERVVASEPHFVVEYAPVESVDAGTARSRSLARRVADEFVRYVQLHPQLADEAQFVVQQADDPDELADIVAAHLQTEAGEKQALLEIVSTQERLLALLESLAEENAVLGIEQEIGFKVQQRIEGAQRQLLLHEKLRVLRDEIEEAGESGDEDIAGYVRRAAEADLSPAARKLVTRELTKLRQAPPMSPEIGVIRGFLDTVLELPWGRLAAAEVDVPKVAKHLERTHYGLRDVKDRILEYLAVCRMRADAARAAGGAAADAADQPATILCLAGPPGTGKSSVAQSIADALGRPFVRVALGGVRDEAEIRGHRRTYIGAMPGRIVDGLAKAGVDNPVMLLDELDKLDSDWRGNPAAALMEVLDPAHNHAFRDNYLEAEYDLSRVFFIATANDVDAIPGTLYDRLEVLHLSGYTLPEKLAIARRHLLPRVARDTGLRREDVRFVRGVLPAIVHGYTREAGVRELERALRRIDRKVARKHLEDGLSLPVSVAAGRAARLPRRGALAGGRAAPRGSRGGEPRPRLHLRRGRGAHHRGDHRPRPRRARAHRAAGRGHAGVRVGGVGLPPLARRARPGAAAGHPAVAVPDQGGTRPRQPGRARARARGRGAQGRPVGRPRARRRDALGARRSAGQAARGHDRRDHAGRQDPARRRPQGEAARGGSLRRPHRRAAGGQPRDDRGAAGGPDGEARPGVCCELRGGPAARLRRSGVYGAGI